MTRVRRSVLVFLLFLPLLLGFFRLLVLLVVDLLADEVAVRVDLDLPVLSARHHVRLVDGLPVPRLLIDVADRRAARLALQSCPGRGWHLIERELLFAFLRILVVR